MPLHVEVRGSGPPLVLLHGFTQTARLWGPFADLLAASRTLVAVDLPGHGDSGSVRADLPTTAGLVAEAVRTQIGDEPSALVGYSLGARVALHVGLATDLPLSHVVFIGVTAGIEDAAHASAGARPTKTLLMGWRHPAMSRRSLTHGSADRCSTGWTTVAQRSAPSGSATAQPAWRRACACVAQAPRSRCGISSERYIARFLLWPGSDDARFAAHALRLARLVPTASLPWFRAAATPCTWPNPSRSAGSCVTGSTLPGPASPEGTKPVPSQQQADRQEGAGDHLEPCRRPQHGQQGPTLLVTESETHGDNGHRERQQCQEGPGPVARHDPRPRATPNSVKQ